MLGLSDLERCHRLRDCGCLTSPRGPHCLPLPVPRACKSSHHRRDCCGGSEGLSFWRPGSSYPTGTCSTRHPPASPLIPYHLWTVWGGVQRAGGGLKKGPRTGRPAPRTEAGGGFLCQPDRCSGPSAFRPRPGVWSERGPFGKPVPGPAQPLGASPER